MKLKRVWEWFQIVLLCICVVIALAGLAYVRWRLTWGRIK